MTKNITLIIFIVLCCTFFVLYIRLKNDFNRVYNSAIGWASIAGQSAAEAHFFNDGVMKEHYEQIVKNYIEHEDLKNAKITTQLDAICWSSFSKSYNRKIDNLEAEHKKLEN
jgi:hypothetical protein